MADYPTDTILALDFGASNTRAALFDVVEGAYRFVACGEAPSTVVTPNPTPPVITTRLTALLVEGKSCMAHRRNIAARWR